MRDHHYHSSNAFLALVALDQLRRNGQQPQPQRAGLLTWLIVLALLAPALPFLLKGALFVGVLGYLALDSLPWREIGLGLIAVLGGLYAAVGLWIATKAWWRGGWAADVVAALLIIAAIGLIWPQTGILDGWVHSARQAAPPVILSEADYQALPSGTLYIGPDGLSRRKR
jgi:hypothetical protein